MTSATESGPAGGPCPAPTAADARQHAPRILVVDDEPINREVVLAMLETVGLTADHAGNGRDALVLAGTTRYDLILMDLHMPHMDGLEATRRIRRLAGYADVPVLAMTGTVLGEIEEECRTAGMSDLVVKPFSLQALLAAVKRWLGPPPGA